MKQYLLRSLLLILIAGAGYAQAVTLGRAQVKSFLGEPLDAEIDLVGLAPGQHQDLRLRIANDEHFERLGIVRDQFHNALQFDVAQSGSRWIVRASSVRPVGEPFVDFPLQMSWPGGQLIKQYTLLLDPPRRIRPARSAPTPRTAPAAIRVTPADGGGSVYGPVQPGEGLLAIAQRLHPRGVTTHQMAMALLRANPHAFIDGDMNMLLAGATLKIPEQELIDQLDATAASGDPATRSQPRQAPVTTSARPPDATAVEPQAQQQKAAPQPAPTSEQPIPADDDTVRLHIVTEADRAPGETDGQQVVQKQLLMALEEIESNRIMTDAIQTSMRRLESELKKMQQVLELKNAQIAALESEIATHGLTQQEVPAEQPASAEASAPSEPEPAEPAAATAEVEPTPVPAPTPQAAPAVELAPAAVAAVSVAAAPIAAAPPSVRPWYEQYLWVVWVILGLMGLTALMLLIRRPQTAGHGARVAGLSTLGGTMGEVRPLQDEPLPESLREAAEDFRRLADRKLAEPTAKTAGKAKTEADTETEADTGAEVEHPKPQPATATQAAEQDQPEISTLPVYELPDESKSLSIPPEPAADATDPAFNDDDIDSWVANLEPEGAPIELDDVDDQGDVLIDDIPGILNELDDQLASPIELADITEDATIQLDTNDEFTEDDAFGMSLDLARAYLEIGDQDGAKDMLQQALSGARDPGHRRQIEELLQQIG